MYEVKTPTPGEILKEDFLDPLNITAYKLSKAIGVDQSRISKIIKGERKISADTALRLSRFFGMSENYWINLQSTYEILEIKKIHGQILDEITTFPFILTDNCNPGR